MKFGVVFSGIVGLIRSRTNYNQSVMYAFSFQLKKINNHLFKMEYKTKQRIPKR